MRVDRSKKAKWSQQGLAVTEEGLALGREGAGREKDGNKERKKEGEKTRGARPNNKKREWG